ncbi:hypothetical protein [Candidatus Vidania fulgoroideorum]
MKKFITYKSLIQNINYNKRYIICNLKTKKADVKKHLNGNFIKINVIVCKRKRKKIFIINDI